MQPMVPKKKDDFVPVSSCACLARTREQTHTYIGPLPSGNGRTRRLKLTRCIQNLCPRIRTWTKESTSVHKFTVENCDKALLRLREATRVNQQMPQGVLMTRAPVLTRPKGDKENHNKQRTQNECIEHQHPRCTQRDILLYSSHLRHQPPMA